MPTQRSWHSIGTGLAVFALMWLLISASPLPALELGLLRWITGIRTNALNNAAVWITNAGSLNVLVPLAVLSAAALFLRRRWVLGSLFLATVLWYPALLPVRVLINREAPKAEFRSPTKGVVYIAEAPIERAGQRQAAAPAPTAPWYEPLLRLLYRGLTRSFPSNHAAASGYFFGLCLLLCWRRGWRILAEAIALLILCIGLSRVYMGVHYPSDVLASWGLALAALSASSMILPFDSFERRNASGDSDRISRRLRQLRGNYRIP
jgi:membrane-associated phospholipid phosphatase